MRKHEGKLVGILGTVIIHLIAVIIFTSLRLKTLSQQIQDEFTVEFEEADLSENNENMIELPSSDIESIFQGDEEMLNIARNLANKPDIKIDPSEYIDMVKNEMIKDGKLGTDNYIDEQKRLDDMLSGENLAYEEPEEDVEKSNEPTESQKMAANYQGPTRIYYELAGRNHTYLPIPIYKCQGSGKVAMTIVVNQRGIVEEVRIIESESTTADICLTETAISTALKSRFNADINAPKIQTGTLTYIFVAQ